jgi:hypothetical protein
MWKGFEGAARTLEQSIARLQTLQWSAWRPQGITVHNTSAPTLAQWAESGDKHDARIRNLESYYENELGWHAGPHWFISRNWINWFSNPLLPGVHSRCFNGTRFGIEMAGDFDTEPFDSGDGKMVRDLTVSWVAALNLRFGFKADDLTFHRECKVDNHACPGKLVQKGAFIDLVKARMADVGKNAPAPTKPADEPKPAEPAPSDVLFQVEGKMSTFGGPRDTGMRSSEGVALFDEPEFARHGLDGWLLSRSQAGAPGIGRRLDPNKPYIACRWDYSRTPRALLQEAVVEIEALGSGAKGTARPMDWGPNSNTGRVADLSPGLAKSLGLQTDDRVRITLRRK